MSCGSSGTGETPQALAPRRLTARPAESKQPGAKINHSKYLLNINKVYEKDLHKRIRV
jgi:hypothetical protein